MGCATQHHEFGLIFRDVVYEPPPGGGAAQVGGNIFILMELVPGGELFKLVAKEKGM